MKLQVKGEELMVNGENVFDAAAKAYLRPFVTPTKGIALRGFMDAVSDPNHEFAKHSSDYTLFEIGTFNEETGLLTPMQTPSKVASAYELRPTNGDTNND